MDDFVIMAQKRHQLRRAIKRVRCCSGWGCACMAASLTTSEPEPAGRRQLLTAVTHSTHH